MRHGRRKGRRGARRKGAEARRAQRRTRPSSKTQARRAPSFVAGALAPLTRVHPAPLAPVHPAPFAPVHPAPFAPVHPCTLAPPVTSPDRFRIVAPAQPSEPEKGAWHNPATGEFAHVNAAPLHCALFENFLASATDPWLRRATLAPFTVGDEVYFGVGPGRVLEAEIRAAIAEAKTASGYLGSWSRLGNDEQQLSGMAPRRQANRECAPESPFQREA
jgi:hypothetical protein